jgi:hypothetical protein
MKIRIAIEREYDLSDDLIFMADDPFFEENKEAYTNEQRSVLLFYRFIEDMYTLAMNNEVEDVMSVTYEEN